MSKKMTKDNFIDKEIEKFDEIAYPIVRSDLIGDEKALNNLKSFTRKALQRAEKRGAKKEREFIRIIATLEAKYSREEGIRVFKGKESLRSLEEIISFSSTPKIIIINQKDIPISSESLKRVYQEIKKRLGKIEFQELKVEKFNGAMIIFDKVIYFPSGKQEVFLIG